MNTYLGNVEYSSQEWNEYVAYTKARSSLFDYYTLPDYEKNKEIYAAAGISENGWKILTDDNHLTFNTEFNAEIIQSLRDTLGNTSMS